MFWDIWEYWTDDNQTKRVKAYRRKSNYYEKKSNALEDYLREINDLLKEAEHDYNLGRHDNETDSANVIKFRYFDVETEMYKQTESILRDLSSRRDTLNTQLNKAQNLWSRYYNIAVREDN